MSENITVDLVLNGGEVDVEATEAAFSSALSTLVSERSIQQNGIGDEVVALLTNATKPLPMMTIASMVASSLGGTAENYAVLSSRVLEFLRANTNGSGRALFTSIKGPKGGTTLASK